jgi:hypothetical protein
VIIDSGIMAKVHKKRENILNMRHCLSVNVCPGCGADLSVHFDCDDPVVYICTRCPFSKSTPNVIPVE